jgi:hypothetical protein
MVGVDHPRQVGHGRTEAVELCFDLKLLRGRVSWGCGLIAGDDGVHQVEKLPLALFKEVQEQPGRFDSTVGGRSGCGR